MGHVGIKEILQHAREKGYGIPCLSGGNMEMIVGQIMAAEEADSPLILFYNSQLTPKVPMELAVPLMVRAAERSRVPVATILDHGTDFASVMNAIHQGASSVMFDGSSLTYEENIQQTREIIKVAHALNVSVEAELGSVGGSAVETGGAVTHRSIATDPEKVLDFVNKTGVDALAVSFGNLHGPYHGEQHLDLGLVRRIRSVCPVPLVMHGGSGLTNQDYQDIIKSGISKVNYYSAMARGAGENMRLKTQAAGANAICHDIITWSLDYFYEETKKLLKVMGCHGQAPAARMDAEKSGSTPSREVLADHITQVVCEVIKRIHS